MLLIDAVLEEKGERDDGTLGRIRFLHDQHSQGGITAPEGTGRQSIGPNKPEADRITALTAPAEHSIMQSVCPTLAK